MKTRLIMLAVSLVIVIGCGGKTAVSAKTYYVLTSGNDSVDGLTEKTAWKTITHAAKVAGAGDTVRIKAGKYDGEHVVITNSGTKDKPVVFEGYAGTPVLDGKERKGKGILLNNREYVVVRNLKLVNYVQGIRIQGCKNVTVDKVTLHDMGSAGFSISAKTQHSTISNCTMRNCNMHCLNFMAESSYNLVDKCTFYITTGEKLSADYGIYTENAHHNTIRNSTIKNLHPGVKGHRGHGIALRISSHDNKVINCECYDVLEAFVVGEDGYKNEFTNCRACADRKVWKKVGHSDGLVARFGAHDNKFINCQSVGCSQGVCLWTMHPNPNAKWVTENVQRRNIFRNCIITGAQEFGIVFNRAEDNRIENCVFDNCACLSYLNGPTANNSLKNCIITGVKRLSYSREKKSVKPAITYSCFWENPFGVQPGKGNISRNPLFVAPGSGDYHLRSQAGRCMWTKAKKKRWVVDITTSICIDAGDPKSEWKNEPKPNGGRVNIGAYGNTPEASKSSASAVVVTPTTKPTALPATNIAPNPGAEKGQGNKLPEGWGFYWSSVPAEVGASAQVRHSGKRSAYLKVTTFQGGYANMGLAVGDTKGYTSPNAIPVKPNTKYHFSFYIKGNGFPRRINVGPWGFKLNGKGKDRNFPSVGVIPTDKWTHYVGSFTTKEETMRVVLMFRVFGKKDSQVKPGAIFYVDDVYLGVGEPAADATMKPTVRTIKVSGKTYYVSASGDDSADGLAEKTAWRTITHAAKVAAAGDTVKIKAGKYDGEKVVVANSGIKDNPIVFEGYGGTPVIDGKNHAGRCVLISGREHVVVRNLKLINYMIGVRILRSKRIVIDKVVCHDMGKGNSGVGFSVSGRSQNCTFSSCRTRDCAMHGLNLMGYSSHNLVENCTFHITTGKKLCSDYGIYTEHADNNTIKGCLIKDADPELKGKRYGGGHGIALRHASHHNKVIDCKCYNLLEALVAGEDSYKNEFINCQAYDTAGVWKRTRHSDGLVARFGAHDNKFINCRSVGCSQGICIWTLEPNPDAKYVTENVQRRNLFRNCVIADAPQYGAVLHRAAGTRIENCVFIKCKCLFTARVTFFGPADYVAKMVPTNLIKNCVFAETDKLSADREMPVVTYSCFWKNSFGVMPGEGNMSKDPLFADPAKGDYHLKSKAGRWDPKTKKFVKDAVDSACIDAGDPKAEWKNEPKPNGGRVNIGAYGNTPEASKSASASPAKAG